MEKVPEYLVHAIQRDTRQPNPDRIGVTELINPPLHRTLYHKHWQDIKYDPLDSIWMILGTALDTIVKKYSQTSLTKLKLELGTTDGITIVAMPDLIDVTNGVMADLKVTSVWSVKDTKKEWEYQLNLYDYMLYRLQNDLWKQINKLEIHTILRDWRKNEKLRYHDYPDNQFVIVPVKRWSTDEQEKFLDAQLKERLLLPNRECTPEEKWQKNDQYACYKGKNKTASRVLDTEVEAQKWINNQKKPEEYKIVKRPGECVRCENYCSVNKFCPYYRKESK